MVAAREMSQQPVTLLRVASDGQLLEESAQPAVQCVSAEVKIFEIFVANELTEAVPATQTQSKMAATPPVQDSTSA